MAQAAMTCSTGMPQVRQPESHQQHHDDHERGEDEVESRLHVAAHPLPNYHSRTGILCRTLHSPLPGAHSADADPIIIAALQGAQLALEAEGRQHPELPHQEHLLWGEYKSAS